MKLKTLAVGWFILCGTIAIISTGLMIWLIVESIQWLQRN